MKNKNKKTIAKWESKNHKYEQTIEKGWFYYKSYTSIKAKTNE